MIYLFRKKPSQLLAVLTAVCMLAAMFPPVGFAANQTRQIITLADGGDLRAAVENANSGDTIQLSGTGYVNAAEGDKPWIIDKNITIQGGTLNLRAGGILLGADAVFAGVTLDFTSNVRNAIMANGHSLTLDNVKASNVSVNLFCGGLIPAGYENFTVPSSGPAGEIIVRGATNLQADTKFGSGNIFAGNLCIGGMDAVHNGASDNGPANVFSGNAVINIEGSASGTSLGEIYACGAQQRIPVGASSGKMTVPNSDDYTVSGTVTVTGDIPHVDGAGSRATDVRYSGSGNAANRVFSRISSLSVENGYLILDAGTSFRTQDAPLSAASGAKLDIQNLGAFPVGSFSGGTLIMGANQTLTINGEVSGETAVAIGGTRPSGDIVVSTGSPVKGHTYIQAPNSTENSFHLLPPAAQLDMTLVRDASGNWTVPDDSTGGNKDLVKDFSFDTTAITAAPGEEVEFPLTVEGVTIAPVYLDYIPLTINVNGYPTNRIEEDVDGEIYYKYASRGNYLTMEIVENRLYVTSDAEWGAAESPYPIEIVLPKEYSASGTILRTSATLTVEGASQPGHTHSWDTAWTSDSDYHWHNCTAADCTVNDNSQKDSYAAHTPSDWIVDQPATETQDGSQYKECTICGHETEREAIPATGTPQPGHTHSWDPAWTSDSGHHWHNCTAAGCTVNDNSQKDGYAAHTPSDWIIDRPATETQEGSQYKACTVCGYETDREAIPATGAPQPGHTHSWDTAWTSDSDYHWHNCTAADCTVNDNSQKDGYAAHTPSDWIIDRPATETQEGSQYKACTVCGYETDREAIPATGTPQPGHTHNWDTSWSSNTSHHWHNCTAAGCTVSDNSQKNGYAAHTASGWIIDRPATATQDGTRHKACTVCGYRMASETIPATGTPQPEHTHKWDTSWASNSSHHWHNCTAAGCTVSDNSQKNGYAAHTPGGWIIDQPATETQDGKRHKECTVCGYKTASETIPATGTPQPEHTHKWDTSWSSNTSHHWHNCTAADCIVSDNSQKNGYAAHTAGDWIIDRPATATQDGTRHKECTVCGYRMASETIPATGTPHVHSWSASWTSDAAHHWHDCTAADCTLSDNSQKSGYAAHTASGWIIDRPASFNQDGTRHKECTVCGYRMAQETIPSTGGGSSGGGSSGGGSSGGSGSSSSSGSGGNTSTTEKHPDGSTTTTVTNQTSGVVTETTKRTDGSIKVVETQKDGTVTSTETAADGGTVKTVEKTDGSSHTSIQQSDGAAAEIAVDASGRIQASVTLPAAASGTVTLPVPKMPVGKDNSSAVTVHTGSGSPVKVRIPAENPTSGTVAVIVHKDGTETVVKTSVPTADSVTAELPDGATVKLVDNRKIFSDTGRHWADNAIDFVSARGLFSGETAAEFKPEGAMTRAMLMTVLARLDGAAGIEDGPAWYEKGIAWAALRGISDGTNPESRITREQLVTMLHRYAGSPSATNKELYFSDAGAVSDYALDAVRWGVERGLLGGHDNGLLTPGGQATRAQAAEILMRYIRLLHQ